MDVVNLSKTMGGILWQMLDGKRKGGCTECGCFFFILVFIRTFPQRRSELMQICLTYKSTSSRWFFSGRWKKYLNHPCEKVRGIRRDLWTSSRERCLREWGSSSTQVKLIQYRGMFALDGIKWRECWDWTSSFSPAHPPHINTHFLKLLP